MAGRRDRIAVVVMGIVTVAELEVHSGKYRKAALFGFELQFYVILGVQVFDTPSSTAFQSYDASMPACIIDHRQPIHGGATTHK